MIAAARRRALIARGRLEKLTRRVDAAANRALVRAWPRMRRVGKAVRSRAARAWRWAGRRLRPVAVLALRGLSRLERRLLQARDLAIRGSTAASRVLTPTRSLAAAVVACAACLVASQFIDYRAIEIGQPGYEGLPAATAPTVDAKPAGSAHAYLLVPLAALAAGIGVAAAATGRRRLGRIVAALGAVSLAVALAVDMPAGLDASSHTPRFAGASGVLQDGFYGELASSAGLILCGLLLSLKPRKRRARARRRLKLPRWMRLPRPRKPKLARLRRRPRQAKTEPA